MLTLEDMLAAKEARANRRGDLLKTNPETVISLTINMPGSVKDSPEIRAVFRDGVQKIENTFLVTSSQICYEKTGPHGLFCISENPESVKEKACELEASSSWSRLWDIDVYDSQGKTVSASDRHQGRSCFLCQELSTVCMREQRHPLEEIIAAANELILDFIADRTRRVSLQAEKLGSLALEGLLHEVGCYPSPGLVDPMDSGSHSDMDFFTFQRSSSALALTLARCAQAGINHIGAPQELLSILRRIGCEGEGLMFAATDGINTQKGLLFSMGVILGAAGILSRSSKEICPRAVCELVSEIADGIVMRELEACGREPHTAGEKIYREFGISGIRGEVEAGFPSILSAGLPAFEKALAQGKEINEALINSLLALMEKVEDTTIMHREPTLAALKWVQKEAAIQNSRHSEGTVFFKEMEEMNNRFIKCNLSPGGSADLLAVTWFLYRLEEME